MVFFRIFFLRHFLFSSSHQIQKHLNKLTFLVVTLQVPGYLQKKKSLFYLKIPSFLSWLQRTTFPFINYFKFLVLKKKNNNSFFQFCITLIPFKGILVFFGSKDFEPIKFLFVLNLQSVVFFLCVFGFVCSKFNLKCC